MIYAYSPFSKFSCNKYPPSHHRAKKVLHLPKVNQHYEGVEAFLMPTHWQIYFSGPYSILPSRVRCQCEQQPTFFLQVCLIIMSQSNFLQVYPFRQLTLVFLMRSLMILVVHLCGRQIDGKDNIFASVLQKETVTQFSRRNFFLLGWGRAIMVVKDRAIFLLGREKSVVVNLGVISFCRGGDLTEAPALAALLTFSLNFASSII